MGCSDELLMHRHLADLQQLCHLKNSHHMPFWDWSGVRGSGHLIVTGVLLEGMLFLILSDAFSFVPWELPTWQSSLLLACLPEPVNKLIE